MLKVVWLAGRGAGRDGGGQRLKEGQKRSRDDNADADAADTANADDAGGGNE